MRYTACLVVALGLIGTSGSARADDARIMGNERFIIAEKDFDEVEVAALSGSGQAAQRLFDYYDMVAVSRDKALYWAQIAAENGSAEGQYTLAMRLLEGSDERSTVRGRFWLRLAAAQGYRAALDALRRPEEKP